MDFYAILVTLTFLAVALVAGNNLSACVGPVVGSRILSKRFGTLLGAAGFLAGLLTQGPSMTRSVSIILPNATALLRSEALLVAILVFVVATAVRVPMSLNMSLVGLLTGLSVASGLGISTGYVIEVFLTWVISPLAAFAVAFYLIRYLKKGYSGNFWRRLQAYKILLVALSFSTAYVLGANTLGLVVATGGYGPETLTAAVAAILVGSFLLSSGVIKRVSEEMFLMRYANATATLLATAVLVEAATLFNIPLSNTQTTVAAVLGTGVSYRTKFVSLKPIIIIVLSWIVAPLLGFAVGLFLG